MADFDEESLLQCICVIIIIAAIKLIRSNSLIGRQWVRPWIERRDKLGAYQALLKELECEDRQSFRNFIRMDRESFNDILNLVTPLIKRKDVIMRNSVQPAERLALTLRFLATGDSYKSLQFLYRIPACTISQIIPETCEAIYNVLWESHLKIPDSQEKWLKISNELDQRWNFPNCIGAIDGKHIAIKCPVNSGSTYYNYKHYFSIILLAIVDADYKFVYIDVGSNGRSNDSGIFGKSKLCKMLENNQLNVPPPKPLPGRTLNIPYVIVGDDAFPLKDYMLKPYPNRQQEFEKRIFNYRLSRARRISENVFGILASRFGVFQKPMTLEPEKATKVTMAACALHNYLRTNAKQTYSPEGSFDFEDRPGQWRQDLGPVNLSNFTQQYANRNTSSAREIRDEFCDYFTSNGQVDWQWECA